MAKQKGNQYTNGVMGGLRRLSGWAMPKAKPFQEMGAAGTAVWAGFIQNREKSPEWIGQRKYVTSQDLATNISIIAAGVHYFLNLTAHPNWTVRPADDDNPEAVRLAEWTEEVLMSLDTPWYRVVRKAAMYRFHGFGLQEWTAIKRTDGSVGFRDVEARPQHTIRQWDTDDDGGILGVWQRNPQTGQLLGIPRGKLVYLVDDTLTDSPEGIGMFRHMADPYNRIKQFFELELRAYERDMRGIPIGRVPVTALNQAVKANVITQPQADAMIAQMRKLVETQVTGKSTGLVLDSQPYINTTIGGPTISAAMQWGFELLQGPGKGFTEISNAIDRTQHEMARIIGVESLMLGDKGGNRALAQDKSNNLYLIANSVLTNIATQCEHDLLMPLWNLNGFDPDLMPSLETEDVTFRDVDSVANTLAKMAQAGAVLSPYDPVVDDVRDLLGVSRTPEPVDGVEGGDDMSFETPTPSDGSSGVDPDTGRPNTTASQGGYSGQNPSPLTAKGVAKGGRRPFIGWRAKLVKENPNHDQQGRFAEGPGGGSSSGERPTTTIHGSGNNKEAVSNAFKAIPIEHAQALKDAGVQFSSQPTVSNGGKQIQGLARSADGIRTVQIADKVNGRNIKDPMGTATHEMGHQLDYLHGLSSKLAPTIRADANKMNEADKYLAAHYLSNDRELFAEAYRLTYSPGAKGAFAMGQKTAERRFANSIAAIKAMKLR